MSRTILTSSLFVVTATLSFSAFSAPKFIETREPVEVVNPETPKKISLDLDQPSKPSTQPLAPPATPPKPPALEPVGLFVAPITLSPDEAKRGLNEDAFIKKARIAFARTDINKDGILNEADKPKPPAGYTPPDQPNKPKPPEAYAPPAQSDASKPPSYDPSSLSKNIQKNGKALKTPAAPDVPAFTPPPAPVAPIITPPKVSSPAAYPSK